MPIAEEFKALAAGNGFPFAFPANYDTLLNNSFKSNNDAAFDATRFLVSDDIELADAMSFYWNFAGFSTFNIGAQKETTITIGDNVTTSIDDMSLSASMPSNIRAIAFGDGSRSEDNAMGLESPRFSRSTSSNFVQALNEVRPIERLHLTFDQYPFYVQNFSGLDSIPAFFIFPCIKANGKFGLVYGMHDPGFFQGVNLGFEGEGTAFGSVITTDLTVKPALGESPAVTIPIQFQGIDYGNLVIGNKTIRVKFSVTSASIVSDFWTYPEE